MIALRFHYVLETLNIKRTRSIRDSTPSPPHPLPIQLPSSRRRLRLATGNPPPPISEITVVSPSNLARNVLLPLYARGQILSPCSWTEQQYKCGEMDDAESYADAYALELAIFPL